MKSLLKKLSIALVGLSSVFASAQDYPIKPVKILVGYVAGGSPDFVARALAQKCIEARWHPAAWSMSASRPPSSSASASARKKRPIRGLRGPFLKSPF